MQRLGLEIHESGINVQAHQIEQLECKHYDRRKCLSWDHFNRALIGRTQSLDVAEIVVEP
jgi:hypothetical protein